MPREFFFSYARANRDEYLDRFYKDLCDEAALKEYWPDGNWQWFACPLLAQLVLLKLADLEGEESNHHSQALWTRGLLIRRNIANGDLATSPPGVRQDFDQDPGQRRGPSLGDRG